MAPVVFVVVLARLPAVRGARLSDRPSPWCLDELGVRSSTNFSRAGSVNSFCRHMKIAILRRMVFAIERVDM